MKTTMRKRKFSPSVPAEPFLVKRFLNPKFAAAYFDIVIADGDQAEFLRSLRRLTKAHGGVSGMARKCKISRAAIVRTLAGSGKPDAKGLAKILAAAGLRLTVRPVARQQRGAR